MSLDEILDLAKSRRGAVAALGVVAFGVILFLALPTISMFNSQDQDISDSVHRLAMLRADAATAPAIRTQLEEARRRAAALPGFVHAPNSALAQSQLQQAIEGIARTAGATIRSAQILPPARTGSLETVAIQYDLSVPMSKLRDLTYAIEAHTPYLFLDEVQITGSQPWQGGTAQDPSLTVRWTVRGYRWAKS